MGLQCLSLGSCQLKGLDVEALARLKELTYLDLARNVAVGRDLAAAPINSLGALTNLGSIVLRGSCYTLNEVRPLLPWQRPP